MIFFPLFMKNKMYNEQTHRGIVLMVEQRSPKPTVVSSSLTAPAKSNSLTFSFFNLLSNYFGNTQYCFH